jgi:hypothetical protein
LIVIVIVLFGALFLVLNQIKDVQNDTLDEKYEAASLDAQIILNDLKNKNIVSDNNVVDVDRLLALEEDEIRTKLGIKNKFCIVFEKDGNLVKIDPENNLNGIGSGDIIVNDEPCK